MKRTDNEIVLPEYEAENLGTPFTVILKNSVRQKLNNKGEVEKTIIPNPKGLLQQIAITRLIHSRKFSGEDIKFIRKSLRMKAKELAEMISVTPEHLSRCESNDRVLSPGLEKCMRLSIIIDTLRLPDEAEDICKNDSEKRKKFRKFQEAFSRLQDLIRDMKIDPVHNSDEKLCLYFYTSDHVNNGYDGDDEDWYDNLSDVRKYG
jgi:transcriptional regulator with XRE-family HTH domain